MRSHLQYISQHFQLSSAKSVVLTGTSAGAIGISLWSNEIQSYLKEDVDLSIILDSGYFLNYPSSKTQTNVFENQLINLFKVSNVDSLSPNKMCNNHYGIDNWKCFLL